MAKRIVDDSTRPPSSFPHLSLLVVALPLGFIALRFFSSSSIQLLSKPFGASLFFFWFIPDDPYYCGLRARVSNFVKNKNDKDLPQQSSKDPQGTEIKMKMAGSTATYQAALPHGHPMQAHQMWHSRSFDSGMGKFA